MCLFTGVVDAGCDFKLPLGDGVFTKKIKYSDAPDLKSITPRVKVVLDAYFRYVNSGFSLLMLSGGTIDQPKEFWDIDNLYFMIKKEKALLKAKR